MTCVECGTEMGTARACSRCGAPVPAHLLDKVGDRTSQQDTVASPPSPSQQPANASSDRLSKSGCLLAVINSVAGIALLSVGATYLTQGSPAHVAQTGQDYITPLTYWSWAIPSAAVLALTAVGVAARRRV